ncbi:MAG: MFS transporter, partial [Phenylobacterium sp.]|nr:MFS transporter [Phenylobacterium sp.]
MTPVTVQADEVSRTSSRYGRYMMVLLTSAFALNLLDRQILNVLAEPIKRDLHLADWQLGALTGLSFALLHSMAALPIARLADRSDRVRII